MRKFILISILGTFAAQSFSQDYSVTATKLLTVPLGQKGSTGLGLGEDAVYSNITNFPGSYFTIGGAENQAGNTITKLVADDLLTTAPNALIDSFSFSITNKNPDGPITFRPRVRFYADNAGVPGAILAGYTFTTQLSLANTATLFSIDLVSFGLTPFAVPADGKVWAGITFDNNGGTTGATAAQLNLFGQLVAGPPTVGSSQDTFFETTAAGSNLINNPPGSLANFGGNPPANFFWALGSSAVPEPASMAVLGLGLLGFVRRRRTNK